MAGGDDEANRWPHNGEVEPLSASRRCRNDCCDSRGIILSEHPVCPRLLSVPEF